jgi:outer membrane autotransporter protein
VRLAAIVSRRYSQQGARMARRSQHIPFRSDISGTWFELNAGVSAEASHATALSHQGRLPDPLRRSELRLQWKGRRRTSPLRAWLASTISLAVLTSLAAAPAQAQTQTWNGSTNTDWFEPTNWSGNQVPTTTTNAAINTLNNAPLVSQPGAVSTTLFVGTTSGGMGELTIQGGGTLGSTFVRLGRDAGSQGTVTVNGGTWTNSADFAVGFNGVGTLTIEGGGTINSNTNGRVAQFAGSQGAVTVTGAGSMWTMIGSLVVGESGTGTLGIANGGSISNGDGRIGENAGSQGTVTVDAATWANSGNLFVGTFGTGELTILGGGIVNNTEGRIAFNIGSQGAVAVTGAGSTWNNSIDLIIGGIGTGTLTIADGGTVTSAGLVSIGQQSGSTGTLNIGAAPGMAAAAPGTLVAPSVQFGAGTGTINFNHTAANYVFALPISGPGSVNQIGPGTTVVTADNTYTGGTTINAGTLQLGNGGASGSILGNVVNNATFAINRSDAFIFDGVISGAGAFRQIGSGTATLTANSSFTGPTTVEDGTLNVTGSIASSSLTTVNSGAMLTGTGTVGNTVIGTGGIFAPGNGTPGTSMTVAGNLAFQSGAQYMVFLNPSTSSFANVTGTASLNGTVQVATAPGDYTPFTTYTILHADGGVTGVFAGLTHDLAFLTPALSYDPNNVFLTLARNNVSFPSVGQTPNQIATAGGVESLGVGNPIFDAVLSLSAAEARQAFDALSGEVHASTAGALLEDSRYPREAVLSRLRQAPFDSGAGPIAALGIGGPALAYQQPVYAADLPVKAPPAAPARGSDLTFWAQGFGAWGRMDSDGNAATLERRFGFAIVGVDGRLADDWRLGFAAGYSQSRISVDARASSATVDSAHAAIYGGKSFGAFNLRGGAAYAHHQIDTTRAIVFPGFADRTTAEYDGSTGQVFGEIGYGLALGTVAVEPFAGLAWVHVETDGFREVAGAAALAGAGNSEEVGYSTLGARFATTFALANGMALTPRISAAWQHAFDKVTPATALAFLSGGIGFGIAGVPIAQDSALLDAGVDLRIMPQATLGISYLGQLANNVEDHAVKGKFVWNF